LYPYSLFIISLGLKVSNETKIKAYGGKDLGKTPFQRAIIQSPGFYPQPSSQKQEAIFNQFLTTAKVKSLKEARALDSKSLIAANALQIGHYALYGQFIYGPTVDGVFAPSLPGKLLASGLFDKTIKVMTSYTTREGLIFTDPSIQDNSALEAYLRANFPQASAISLKYIVEVLYPPIFDGSQPYTDQSGRVSLLIAEMTFVCNTFYTHKAFLNDTYAFQFGIAPGLHAGDLPYTFYQDAAASPAVSNITAALAIQNFETTFAQTGAPKWKGLMSFPQYGAGANIVNITQSRIYKTRDPAANSRCDWWQQGLLF
jgi:carboxylesterase type B